MSRSSSVLLIISILHGLFVPTWSAGSCQNYEKGDFKGNVTSKEICEDACQAAEGFCCPDFKENNGTYKCACLSCDSCSDKQTRSLCEDENFSSSANSLFAGTVIGGVVAMGLILTEWN